MYAAKRGRGLGTLSPGRGMGMKSPSFPMREAPVSKNRSGAEGDYCGFETAA